jgi:predicted ArsR family transcriptional regulator
MSDRNRMVWETLRDQGPLLARDIAEVTGLTRTQVSATITGLERKGTVTMVGQRTGRQPGIYAAIGPGCAKAAKSETEEAGELLDGLTRCWGVKREELQEAA